MSIQLAVEIFPRDPGWPGISKTADQALGCARRVGPWSLHGGAANSYGERPLESNFSPLAVTRASCPRLRWEGRSDAFNEVLGVSVRHIRCGSLRSAVIAVVFGQGWQRRGNERWLLFGYALRL